jgi:hypothetical protein
VEPVERLMLRVAETCERLRLSYYVTGSFASMTWGEPRYTQDVDVVVELPSWKVREFCAAFPEPEFYVSEEAAMAAARGPSQFNIIWGGEGVKADIMVFRDTPFDESRLSRARRVEVPELGSVMVAAPEDIILKKLEFFKEGGSDKHTRDITTVLKTQGAKIDLAYIERWVARIGVEREWAMIKERLGLP